VKYHNHPARSVAASFARRRQPSANERELKSTIINRRLEGSPSLALRNDNLWYKDSIIYQLHVRTFYDSQCPMELETSPG